ncbi:TPA: hypothetical protein DEF17_04240 [bacterium]|nr:MAG: hypothetical protein AUJ18_08615 [Candidatus Hydrogenedentes bacterium CG1_02_42_14]PIU47590.1 MAG: hypothetical protein COS94_06565 [Candidatus Hydrogenedentes bacterium CG07_land_8_20_14_0_80_42_17]HBW47124.1 hypothetical protein [bacterium]
MKIFIRKFTVVIVFALLLGISEAAPARIKLVALPERASISISIEHPSETLVQEERILTLQKGVNQVDFSWQGVQIDADAILLESLDHPDEIKLISIRYPSNENALVWDIFSPRAMLERVRVTYFLDGIGRDISYRAVSDLEEKNLFLKQYLKLRNNSGERLEHVKVYTGFSKPYVTDIDNGEMRQTLVFSGKVPFSRQFIWDSSLKPHDPSKENITVGIPISYNIKNESASGLGLFPLRYGKARIFQEEQRGGSAFLGEDWGQYTPISKEMKLSVGESRDIKVTRKLISENRTKERRNSHNRVVLFDKESQYEITVENFKDSAAEVSILDYFDNTWDITSSTHEWSREDFRTVKFHIPIAASDSVTVRFTLQQRNLSERTVLR